MSSKPSPAFIGEGGPESDLSAGELRAILDQVFSRVSPGARVLTIIPDKTRDDNTTLLFPFAAEILAARKIAQLDALVAQGTHLPMTDEEKRSKTGGIGKSVPGLGRGV
jgi:lactate racemase